MLKKTLTLILITFQSLLVGQTINGLKTSVTIPPTIQTIDEVLNFVNLTYGITFSYSSNQFNGLSKVKLLPGSNSLNKVIRAAFYRYNVGLKELDNNKILITPSLKRIRIHGLVKDKSSGELLAGVLLINQNHGDVNIVNENGYYSLSIQNDTTKIECRLLGYIAKEIKIIHDGRDINKDVYLQFQNEITPVIIKNNVTDHLIFDPGAEIIDQESSYGHKGVTGEDDLLFDVRMKGGIASGTEGVLGLNVQGGNSDENLILLEGLPLYEVSHVAGLSSIFLTEAVKSVNLSKYGIPARYGGRLSSVLNIQLKEGHKDNPKRSVSLGLTSAKFGFEGPIGGEKTTFNLAGRSSLFDYTFGPIINKYSSFEGVNFNYQDLIGKLTHRINNRNKISIATYLGGDRTKLSQRDTIITSNSFYRNRDINQINWGNKLVGINYNSILNSKSTINIAGGWTKYNYFSRGYYELESRFDTFNIKRSVNVESRSDITDFQFGASFDYYFNDQIKAKVGVQRISHKFQPTVKQSLLIIDDEQTTIAKTDSTIRSIEYASFVEFNLQLAKFAYLYPGVHINTYTVEGVTYKSIQPRLRFIFMPLKNTLISASYSELSQNLHLLSKPGIGIASDLWVPSTNNITPSEVSQFDIELTQKINSDFTFDASFYTKRYTNLIEYSVPVDLHANVILQDNNQLFFTNDNDWRQNLNFGRGRSIGFATSIKKVKGNTKGWVSYHYNQSKRQFDEIDDGEEFPAKYERPHDINIAISHEFSNKFILGASWIYTSGSTFSLANEGFDSALGIKLLKPDSRNNYRLPAYHRLSITGEISTNMFNTEAHINFGLNNVYNRFNPFFIYAANNPESTVPVLKKVTIFPILPFFNITWNW